MSNQAVAMYALGLDQAAALVTTLGKSRTVLVQGHMGTGKSSMLKMIAKAMPTHAACYFDCTTKDLGDITIPNLQMMEGEGFVRYVANEELGVHLGKPIILMIDEFGKANRAVQNALTRLMLERKIGSYTPHPDSIVFATTNLGGEGVGDLLAAHHRNRITVVTTRKPTNTEWIEWGLNNGIDHTVLGFARDFPQIFQSFDEVKDPETNPYIFHPKSTRAAFITPRSMEAASDIMKLRGVIDSQTQTAALMGTIGERGAMDLMAFEKLSSQWPTLESIKKDPLNAKVPTSDAAVAMVVYRTLTTIERDWIEAWMDYMQRLDKEAQGLFGKGVASDKYDKRAMVMGNARFRKWALENNYMFATLEGETYKAK